MGWSNPKDWHTTTVIVRHDPNTVPCPRCGGSGHLDDGGGSWSLKILPDGSHEITHTYQDSTICPVCKGKGRVRILPLEEWE